MLPLRAPGGYVAIVALYHALTQTMDLQIAASRDGINWWRPDRRPCIANDPLGDFCGGMRFPTRTLIEHNGAYILYLARLDGIHGDIFDTEPNEQYRAAGLPARPEEFLQRPDNTRLTEVFFRGQWYRDWELHGEPISTRPSSIPFHGGTHRAHWPAGRLWAAVPAYGGPSEAVATTHAQEWPGRRLLLNATTLGDGAVAAELLDGDGRTLEGFSREECHAFRGDQSRAPLRWKSGDAPPTTRAFIRFVLRWARLYGFGFE